MAHAARSGRASRSKALASPRSPENTRVTTSKPLRRAALGAARAIVIAAAALASAAAARADGSQLKLREDFATGAFTQAGGLHYKDNAEQAGGTVEFRQDGGRAGGASLALTVHDACKSGADHCSDRAEVWERPETLAAYGAQVWYAFSMKFAQPVPQDDHRYVMAQWKRAILPGAAGDFSPFLALRLNKGRLIATVENDSLEAADIGPPDRAKGCLPGEARANSVSDLRQTRALVAVQEATSFGDYNGFPQCALNIEVISRGAGFPPPASGWIDFVFAVKPGPSGDGLIEIAANGRWIATVKGRIGHAGEGLGPDQYFKFGPYRAGHDGAWTLYFDAFRRGPGCFDVTAAELCKIIDAGG